MFLTENDKPRRSFVFPVSLIIYWYKDMCDFSNFARVELKLFFGLGIATTFLISRFLPIPYTVVIFLIGTLFSFPFNDEDPTIHNSLNMWYAIDPELILFVFLPALLFGESMSLKIHDIRSSIGASCILAGNLILIMFFQYLCHANNYK